MKSLSPQIRTQQIRWNTLLQSVRDYFLTREVLEVQTPTLVPSPGVEAHLEGFQTEFQMGSRKQVLFLPTSPEFHLKKIAFSGWRDIFEIKTCFRNGELSAHHQPEFTMLEWYRSFENLSSLIEDSIELLFHLCDRQNISRPRVERTNFNALFQKYLSFKLTPETLAAELQHLCDAQKIHRSGTESWDDLFHLLLIEKIEPALDKDILTIIEDFPASQAALAQVKNGWAQRFEMYWKGLEICNAYQELLDPKEQRARWDKINELREGLGRKPVELDEELLAVMQGPLKPACGNAMGLERVFMAMHGISRIEDLRIFSIGTEIKP